MQVLFKTHYDQDINHMVDRGERFRISLAILLALLAPLAVGSYFLTELSIFLVYILAGIGLMVLTGFSGQVSFGHAAFLGIGAYGHAVLMGYGVPFLISLPAAALLSGLVGAALGRAVSKMHGFYLAIATLAFVIIVETAIGEWEPVTGGHIGLQVPSLVIAGYELGAAWQQYYLILAVVLFCIWGVANLMRSPTGRAFIAVRDSETSARSLGLDIARTKILAFFISALITLDPEKAPEWARAQGIAFDDVSDLAENEKVRAMVQSEIDKNNGQLASFEQIKKFVILPEDLSIEGGELTPTLKLKRKVIDKKYGALIDALYK